MEEETRLAAKPTNYPGRRMFVRKLNRKTIICLVKTGLEINFAVFKLSSNYILLR